MDGERGPGGRDAADRRSVRTTRLAAIAEIVGREPVANQHAIAEALAARGIVVDAATVSRDVAALGLVKVMRGGRRVYALPDAPGVTGGSGSALARLLRDLPIELRRSGLTLLLITRPGMASALAQTIDESGLREQEGTLAGENTVLVLFADEERLERWRERFLALRAGRDGENDG